MSSTFENYLTASGRSAADLLQLDLLQGFAYNQGDLSAVLSGEISLAAALGEYQRELSVERRLPDNIVFDAAGNPIDLNDLRSAQLDLLVALDITLFAARTEAGLTMAGFEWDADTIVVTADGTDVGLRGINEAVADLGADLRILLSGEYDPRSGSGLTAQQVAYEEFLKETYQAGGGKKLVLMGESLSDPIVQATALRIMAGDIREIPITALDLVYVEIGPGLSYEYVQEMVAAIEQANPAELPQLVRIGSSGDVVANTGLNHGYSHAPCRERVPPRAASGRSDVWAWYGKALSVASDEGPGKAGEFTDTRLAIDDCSLTKLTFPEGSPDPFGLQSRRGPVNRLGTDGFFWTACAKSWAKG